MADSTCEFRISICLTHPGGLIQSVGPSVYHDRCTAVDDLRPKEPIPKASAHIDAWRLARAIHAAMPCAHDAYHEARHKCDALDIVTAYERDTE